MVSNHPNDTFLPVIVAPKICIPLINDRDRPGGGPHLAPVQVFLHVIGDSGCPSHSPGTTDFPIENATTGFPIENGSAITIYIQMSKLTSRCHQSKFAGCLCRDDLHAAGTLGTPQLRPRTARGGLRCTGGSCDSTRLEHAAGPAPPVCWFSMNPRSASSSRPRFFFFFFDVPPRKISCRAEGALSSS